MSVPTLQQIVPNAEDRAKLDRTSIVKYDQGRLSLHSSSQSFQQVLSTYQKLPPQAMQEPSEFVKNLTTQLETHKLLTTRFAGALDRLETLAGSKHRGFAGLRAWKGHFDAVADLVEGLAKVEREVVGDGEVKAFVAGKGGKKG